MTSGPLCVSVPHLCFSRFVFCLFLFVCLGVFFVLFFCFVLFCFCTVLRKVLYVAQAGLRTGENSYLRFSVGISGTPHSAQLNPLVSQPFIHYPSGDSLANSVLSTFPSSPSVTPTQVPETCLPSSGSPLKFLVKESVMKYDSSQVNLALRRIWLGN